MNAGDSGVEISGWLNEAGKELAGEKMTKSIKGTFDRLRVVSLLSCPGVKGDAGDLPSGEEDVKNWVKEYFREEDELRKQNMIDCMPFKKMPEKGFVNWYIPHVLDDEVIADGVRWAEGLRERTQDNFGINGMFMWLEKGSERLAELLIDKDAVKGMASAGGGRRISEIIAAEIFGNDTFSLNQVGGAEDIDRTRLNRAINEAGRKLGATRNDLFLWLSDERGAGKEIDGQFENQ